MADDIVEITDTITDLNDEDRVFRVGPYIVKVKTLHDDAASRVGQEIYRFSGSICDARGKALRRADGGLCVHDLAHSCTVQVKHVVGDDGELTLNAPDVAEHLALSTRICITETIHAQQAYETRQSTRGVGSLSAYRARTGAALRH